MTAGRIYAGISFWTKCSPNIGKTFYSLSGSCPVHTPPLSVRCITIGSEQNVRKLIHRMLRISSLMSYRKGNADILILCRTLCNLLQQFLKRRVFDKALRTLYPITLVNHEKDNSFLQKSLSAEFICNPRENKFAHLVSNRS